MTNNDSEVIDPPHYVALLLEAKGDALSAIKQSDKTVDLIRLEVLGNKSRLAELTKQIKNVPQEHRQQAFSR